ncbi:MAG: DUF922 domain-containing protein [Pyrinomonadaceae bacterium]
MTYKLITENTPFLSFKEKIVLENLKFQIRQSTFETPKKEYYEVSGVTFDELYKSMKIEAAKAIPQTTEEGDQAIGITNTFFSFNLNTYRYGQSNHTIIAYPVGLTIQARTIITLPRFRGIVVPRDAERWYGMIKALDKHEQGHVCISLDTFNRIKQAFFSVTGLGKTKSEAQNNLNYNVNKIYDDNFADNKLKQAKYDLDTNHGSKPTEQEQYTKQFSDECNKIYPEI